MRFAQVCPTVPRFLFAHGVGSAGGERRLLNDNTLFSLPQFLRVIRLVVKKNEASFYASGI